MESFAFPAKNNSINTEIPQKCSKLYYFSLESFEYSLYVLNWRNAWIKKAKPHKQSLVEGGQNGIQVLGICRFAPEEFGNKD